MILVLLYQRNSTNYDDDSESDDESDTVDNDKELLEQFLLAELAIMDTKIPDDDIPKLKICGGTPANAVIPIEDNPSTPENSVNPVAEIPQETGIIVIAEEVTILPNIMNSKPSCGLCIF